MVGRPGTVATSWGRHRGAINADVVLPLRVWSDTILLACTSEDASVHVSTDRGETWTAGGPVPSESIYRLAVHPQLPEAMYGVNWGSMLRRYRSADVGHTWTMYSRNTFGSRHLDMEVTRGDPDRAYVLDIGPVAAGVNGTTDGGNTWSQDYLFSEWFYPGLGASAHYPDAVFVSGYDRVVHNIGGTWTEVPIIAFEGIWREIVLPDWSRDMMFLAGGETGADPQLTVIRSTDLGSTWIDVSDGLPDDPLPSIWDLRMVASPDVGRIALGLWEVNGRPEVWVREEVVTTSAPTGTTLRAARLSATPVPSAGPVVFVFDGTPLGEPLGTRSDLAGAFPIPLLPTGSLRIWDAAGRLKADLIPEASLHGSLEFTWNGRDTRGSMVPAGKYFARIGGETIPVTIVR